jgi:hypothetical protein
VDIEISSAERKFGRENDTSDAIADEQNITDLKKARADAGQQRREIDLEILRQNSDRETDKGDAVDELWRRKLRARRSATSGDEYSQTVLSANGSSGHFGSRAEETSD